MASFIFCVAAILCFAAAAGTGSLGLFCLGTANLSNAVVFADWGGDER